MHYRGLLLLAGMYTIAWSTFYVYFGETVVNWMAMGLVPSSTLPSYFFGIFGMVVGLVIFFCCLLSGFLGLVDFNWNLRQNHFSSLVYLRLRSRTRLE